MTPAGSVEFCCRYHRYLDISVAVSLFTLELCLVYGQQQTATLLCGKEFGRDEQCIEGKPKGRGHLEDLGIYGRLLYTQK
jgi:hypothetical protein